MKWKCIAVDFDHTLARLNDPEYRGLFAIFTERDVSREIVKSSYEEVKASNGFSIHNLMDQISGKINFALDREAIRAAFTRYLEKKLLPYTDTLPAFEGWRALGIPVVIVTAGEERYQREKVRATKIPCDDLLIIPRANEKAELVHSLRERYGKPLAVFDDKATELDSLRDHHLLEDEVVTVRVRRPDSPYYHQIPRHRHIEVATLTDDALVGFFGIAA